MFSRHSDRAMRDAEPVPTALSRNGHLAPVPQTQVREAEPLITPVSLAVASVVGREDVLDGSIHVRQALRIYGRVTGKIQSDSSITIEEGGVVEADIIANEVTIAGNYSGSLVCRERLEIRPTGFAKGELETVRLMLHEGGFIDGALRMKRPEPVRSQRLAEAPPAAYPIEPASVPVTTSVRSFSIAAPTTRGATAGRALDAVGSRGTQG